MIDQLFLAPLGAQGVRLSVCPSGTKCSRVLNLLIFILEQSGSVSGQSQVRVGLVSGQSQVSLRSVSGQSQVILRSVSGQSQVSLRSVSGQSLSLSVCLYVCLCLSVRLSVCL